MKTKPKLLFYAFCCKVLLLCCCSNNVYAQDQSLEGTVKGSDGTYLDAVTVSVKDMPSIATATDKNGRFKLSGVPAKSVLVFRLIGFQTQEVQVLDKTNIDVTMVDEQQWLQEVVAVGYGTVRKRDFRRS